MMYFLRKSRFDKNIWKNLSFLFIVLILGLSMILGGNFKFINNFQIIDKQSRILSSDSEFIWDQTWGGNESDVGFAIWCNGTYIYTSGTTESFGEGDRDLLLIKWDTEGNQIWNRTWGGNETDGSYAIWGNGTYIYTSGYTKSFTEGGEDLLIVKWDADGNQIWNRTWGGSYYECSESIWGDGTYLYTTGHTDSYGAGSRDLLIVKWDADGSQIWNRTWGGVDNDYGFILKGNGNYIYTSGSTQSFGGGGQDLFIIKWDTDGNQIWNRTWGDIEDQSSTSLWCDETYFYTTAINGNFLEDELELFLIKWDYDGNQIWNQSYDIGENMYITSIWSDGTYLYATGANIYSGFEEAQLIFLVWDTEGNLIIEKYWGDNGLYIGSSICGDESFIYICGSEGFLTGDFNQLLLIKTNHFSLSAPVLGNIYPDPDVDGNITINWNDVVGATSYEIYRDSSTINDITDLVPIGNSTSSTYIDYGLSNGTYYYVIVSTRENLISPISNCESVEVEISPESEDPENKIPGYPLILPILILGIFIARLSFRRYRKII